MEILKEYTAEELAAKLYEMAKDMDYMDYADTKEQDIVELEQALYTLKLYASNEYNTQFRLIWNMLQKIN